MWVDIFNGEAQTDLSKAHLLQNETSMTMIALKPIKQGEEVFNDYGQLPRSDLLRRYGYVTDRYKRWDVVKVSIASVTKVCNAFSKLSETETQARVRTNSSSP